jgi:predicted  nucleic acid-binding Zn-ribbon protein
MTFSDQLSSIQSRMDAARQARRFASAVGRRNEAQYLDLELDDLQSEESALLDRIAELNEHGNPKSINTLYERQIKEISRNEAPRLYSSRCRAR